MPAWILFGYYFAIMKIYALCTLHETGWGTRTGIADPATATQALKDQNAREKADGGGGGGMAREDVELGGFGGRHGKAN